MTKHISSIFIVAVTALSIGSGHAAEEDTETPESNPEEVVLNQAEDADSEEAETASQQGDDDFVPSAQISEDLSVSFPVDI